MSRKMRAVILLAQDGYGKISGGTIDAAFKYPIKSNAVVYVCANGTEIPETIIVLTEVKQ